MISQARVLIQNRIRDWIRDLRKGAFLILWCGALHGADEGFRSGQEMDFVAGYAGVALRQVRVRRIKGTSMIRICQEAKRRFASPGYMVRGPWYDFSCPRGG